MTLAALMFAVMAVCAKLATATGLAAPEVACLRFGFGLLSGIVPLSLGVRLRPRNYRALFLRGLLGGLSVLAYFAAIAHLPVGLATLLNYSSPVFVALFSTLFLGEPLGVRDVLAFLMTSAGVVMVVVGSAPQAPQQHRASLMWSLVGVASAVLSGGAVTTVRSMRSQEGSWEIFLAFCLVGLLITVAPTAAHWVTPSAAACKWLLLMSATSVASQVLMTYALRDLLAVRAGLILQLTPIATFLMGLAVLHDEAGLLSLVGAGVTLTGVSWGVLVRTRN